MKFSDIPGHLSVKHDLRTLADSNRMPHAIMLCGPSGIGKMMLARAFVNYVHCTDRRDGEPCGKCAACRQHASFNNPDTFFIYPIVKSEAKKILLSSDRIEQWKEMLSNFPTMQPEKWNELIEAGNSQPIIYVNDAQAIVQHEALSNYASDYKFFIIWLPERLQTAAANKLLKVIEEPSPGTVFILVSNEDSKVLPTISSRTRRFNMTPLSREEIEKYMMERYGMKDYEAFELSKLAEGRLSKADEVAGFSEEKEEFEALYRDIMRNAYAKKLGMLRNLSERAAAFGREKLLRFLDYMGRLTRENFIFNMKMPQLSVMTRSEEEFSKRFSPFINHTNVEEMIAEIGRAQNEVARNANAKIVLFDLFLLLIILLLRKPK
ncbi:MAG: DNA polymerase III subunit delta [Muribaculaceae bacterium]|nr:DNA polymerase III subunit delta [Muribaculaceae bacterium]